jgi:hypothetical protein
MAGWGGWVGRRPMIPWRMLLMCASAHNRHAAPGVSAKEASIRVMRGKGGFLTAPRAEGEPGSYHTALYSAACYW